MFACVCVPQTVVSVCVPHSKSYMYTIVSRLVEARYLVCRVRYYLQSPPNVRLRLFAPALVPLGLGFRSVILVPSCFVASH